MHNALLCLERRGYRLIFNVILKLLQKKIVRFTINGGIGIIINNLALAGFLFLLGKNLHPLAVVLSFIVSNAINFVMNQLITYPELKPHSPMEWLRRLVLVQLTSATGLAVASLVAIVLVQWLHINEFIANPIGLCFTFVYKYLVSDRFVYRSKRPVVETPLVDPLTPPPAESDMKSIQH